MRILSFPVSACSSALLPEDVEQSVTPQSVTCVLGRACAAPKCVCAYQQRSALVSAMVAQHTPAEQAFLAAFEALIKKRKVSRCLQRALQSRVFACSLPSRLYGLHCCGAAQEEEEKKAKAAKAAADLAARVSTILPSRTSAAQDTSDNKDADDDKAAEPEQPKLSAKERLKLVRSQTRRARTDSAHLSGGSLLTRRLCVAAHGCLCFVDC